MPDIEPIILSIVGIRNTSECWLNFNNGESIRCSIDIVSKYYLKRAMLINSELMNNILSEQRIINVKKSAYRYASFKPRTVYQVKDKLNQLGYEPSEIEIGINFLVQFNFLDDYAYAKNYIKNRAKAKKFGKSRIIIELKKLRINEELIETALSEDYDEEATYNDAVDAYHKKIRMLTNKPLDKQKRAVIDYLARRGFTWSIISKVLENNFNIEPNEYDFD